LRAFFQLSDGTQILSDPRYVDFRPQVDPTVALKTFPSTIEREESVVMDEGGKILAEASLVRLNDAPLVFGSDCPLTLNLLVRQAKSLPRKAKSEVFELHKYGDQQQTFVLSQGMVSLPGTLKAHQETVIPLNVPIPFPDDYTRKGATGLPTMCIQGLTVEYFVRVTIYLNSRRLSIPIRGKTISVDCPLVVGNVKPKSKDRSRRVPRLVVSVGDWDTQSSTSSNFSRDQGAGKKTIVEWTEESEIPRFLPGGDMDEDDIL
jgi:hypothetical protein